LGNHHYHGYFGLQQDQDKTIELWKQAAKLGFSQAHFSLGNIFVEGGAVKKAKFHWEAAAMAGHEFARCSVGVLEFKSGNLGRALKHLVIAASAGCHYTMHNLQKIFNRGFVSRIKLTQL
jgi:TPR repeat protein